MTETLDLRGLACPEPAIQTGKALRDANELKVIVDDQEAVQNISRGVKARGYVIDVKEIDGDFHLFIEKEKTNEGLAKTNARLADSDMDDPELDFTSMDGPTVAFFGSNSIGRGNDELGQILARSIIYSFLELEVKPDTIIFMNSGVELAIEGAKTLEDLNKLLDMGVEILVCGTCLGYLGIKDKLAVGEVSNAYTITEALFDAAKVVRF